MRIKLNDVVEIIGLGVVLYLCLCIVGWGGLP